MESPDFSPPRHADASRPSLGFPLGTALLLIIIFSLSGIFSCCYHWDRLKSLRRSFSDEDDHAADIENQSPSSKSNPSLLDLKQNERRSLPVIMPGDIVPKFIALPCPCEPQREEKVEIQVPKPPKPPRMAVPLY